MSERIVYIWEGPRTERLEIRCTPAEKVDLKRVCLERGRLTITQYLLALHHKEQGRI